MQISAEEVRDEQAALKIARLALVAKFGITVVSRFDPYRAELKDKVWTVFGTLPYGFTRGGTPEALISQQDGRVLRVSHGK